MPFDPSVQLSAVEQATAQISFTPAFFFFQVFPTPTEVVEKLLVTMFVVFVY